MRMTTPMISLTLAIAAAASGGTTFTRNTIATSTDEVHGLAAGQINSDGIMDLAAAQTDSDRVVWYQRFGTAFAERIVDTPDGPRTIEVVDLNGDGFDDLLVSATNDWQIIGYISDGMDPPAFTKVEVAEFRLVNDAHAVDLDLDGDLDIVATSEWLRDVAVYRNDGNDVDGLPMFTDEGPIDAEFTAVKTVASGDVDGDGYPEIVAGGNALVRLYSGFQGSGFTEIWSWSVYDCLHVEIADLDRDGDNDVIASTRGFDNVLYFYENFGGSPPAFITHIIATQIGNPWQFAISDFDEDGRFDLVIPETAEDRLVVYSGVDVGPSDPPAFTQEDVLASIDKLNAVCVGDFDGDGDDDIATNGLGDQALNRFTIELMENQLVPPAPVIIQDAESAAAKAPASILLEIEATGVGPFDYQWTKDGVPVAGADGPSLMLVDAGASDSGRYACVVTNQGGSTTSADAIVAVTTCIGDVNSDGMVTFDDLNLLLDAWGVVCPD